MSVSESEVCGSPALAQIEDLLQLLDDYRPLSHRNNGNTTSPGSQLLLPELNNKMVRGRSVDRSPSVEPVRSRNKGPGSGQVPELGGRSKSKKKSTPKRQSGQSIVYYFLKYTYDFIEEKRQWLGQAFSGDGLSKGIFELGKNFIKISTLRTPSTGHDDQARNEQLYNELETKLTRANTNFVLDCKNSGIYGSTPRFQQICQAARLMIVSGNYKEGYRQLYDLSNKERISSEKDTIKATIEWMKSVSGLGDAVEQLKELLRELRIRAKSKQRPEPKKRRNSLREGQL